MDARLWRPFAVRWLILAMACVLLYAETWAVAEDEVPPQSVGSLLSRRNRETASPSGPVSSPAPPAEPDPARTPAARESGCSGPWNYAAR